MRLVGTDADGVPWEVHDGDHVVILDERSPWVGRVGVWTDLTVEGDLVVVFRFDGVEPVEYGFFGLSDVLPLQLSERYSIATHRILSDLWRSA